MKICSHVNDCKLIHKSPKVFVDTIKWLIQEYGSIFENRSGAMSVIRVNIHKYLGMNLDYTFSGIVRISVLEYIDKILTAFDKTDPSNSGNKSSTAP